jgi:hypothetical protein
MNKCFLYINDLKAFFHTGFSGKNIQSTENGVGPAACRVRITGEGSREQKLAAEGTGRL